MFVTDGLVERRAGSIDDGLARLRDVVGDGAGDLEVLLDRILLEVGPGEAAEDDVAVLAIRIGS